MNKEAAIRVLAEAAVGIPTVFTTGYTCRIAAHVADRPSQFYMTGSMGLAAAIGIGIALETGTTTIVVDGDGSLLMNPVSLITAGSLPGLPLLHVLLDDGRYASTGGQETLVTTDLCAWARAAGYTQVCSVREAGEFHQALTKMRDDPVGPSFLRCALDHGDALPPPRLNVDLAALAVRFGSAIRHRTN